MSGLGTLHSCADPCVPSAEIYEIQTYVPRTPQPFLAASGPNSDRLHDWPGRLGKAHEETFSRSVREAQNCPGSNCGYKYRYPDPKRPKPATQNPQAMLSLKYRALPADRRFRKPMKHWVFYELGTILKACRGDGWLPPRLLSAWLFPAT